MRSKSDDFTRLLDLIELQEREGNLHLPAEPRLSERIGVTRARLRTLLKKAESQGLIWRHVGKGTFIGPRPVISEEAVQGLAISPQDLYDARALIEPALAAQAALHATTQDVVTMETVVRAMAATTSFQEWRRLDARLHRLIALATHNPLLVLIHDTLRVPLKLGLEARLEEVFSPPPQPRRATNSEHTTIVEAIAMHNPAKAEGLMLDHIVSVRDQLFGSR